MESCLFNFSSYTLIFSAWTWTSDYWEIQERFLAAVEQTSAAWKSRYSCSITTPWREINLLYQRNDMCCLMRHTHILNVRVKITSLLLHMSDKRMYALAKYFHKNRFWCCRCCQQAIILILRSWQTLQPISPVLLLLIQRIRIASKTLWLLHLRMQVNHLRQANQVPKVLNKWGSLNWLSNLESPPTQDRLAHQVSCQSPPFLLSYKPNLSPHWSFSADRCSLMHKFPCQMTVLLDNKFFQLIL